jgi:hypothetical protein
MMDEIKQLIEMIAKLPQLAIWVLVAFWAYKVIVIGSVYGVIRFVVEKAHSWAVCPKELNVRPMLERWCIPGEADDFIAQVKRIKGKGTRMGSEYVHGCSVAWLREAINEKEARERAEGKQ